MRKILSTNNKYHRINMLYRYDFGRQNAHNMACLRKVEVENKLRNIFKAARMFVFGGCRHRKMGWPIWLGGSSYRVCLDCGIQRLFDEDTLRGYGPYSYHINELLSGEGAKRTLDHHRQVA